MTEAPVVASRGHAPAVPRAWPVRRGDVAVVVGLNAVLVVGMWVRHGGTTTMTDTAGFLTGLGQVTALLGTYAALVQVVMMSRSPFLDSLFGLDRLAHWHRWLGFSCAALIGGHVVFSTVGYALGDGSSVTSEAWTLVTTYPYMLMATAATALLVMTVVTSLRVARRRMAYETWHFLHLYGYLMLALAFGHEVMVGSDLSGDPVARDYWVALYVVVAALVLAFRIGHPLLLSRRHLLRVDEVVEEAPGVHSVYVTGRDLDRLPARAGQFFKWRFLTRDTWWKAHPFSLSAAPDGECLRLTVRGVGDFTSTLGRVRPGTRVAVEGPFGLFTASLRSRPRVLLVAGGIGITPLRALLEEMPRGKGATMLIYRARSWDDLVFRDEIEDLVSEKGGTVRFVVGRRGVDAPREPFAPRLLREMVPDAKHRDVFICGPLGMMDAVERSLLALDVPRRNIHRERFALL